MDEALHRTTQTLESFKVQLSMAAQSGKEVVQEYSTQGKTFALQALHSPKLEQVQQLVHEFLQTLRRGVHQTKEKFVEITDLRAFYGRLARIFHDKLARNNAFYMGLGLIVGVTGGILIGVCLASPVAAPQLMKAVTAVAYHGIDSITLNHHMHVPSLCCNTDVLIRVRATCIQRVDERIAKGYGRTLRKLIGHNQDSRELPIVLGRSCAGVIESIGKNCEDRLEIGDEVWVAVPYHCLGLASQLVVVPQDRVGRKPRTVGFEGACSLPYSGCIALTAIRDANLDENNSLNKRIFIQNGCSPVGCVLSQLLHHWGAHVTVSCPTRSAPVATALGADDVITITKPLNVELSIDDNLPSQLGKELSVREPYDAIFLTGELDYYKQTNFQLYLNNFGTVINTVEPDLTSDSFGIVLRSVYYIWIRTMSVMKVMLGHNQTNETGLHFCHVSLDKLCSLVDASQLQTVIDKVFVPQDAELAFMHVVSEESIGNTVITFR